MKDINERSEELILLIFLRIKMFIPPKAVYTLKAIIFKIPITFFIEIEQKAIKFVWNRKRLWIAKAILGKKKKAGAPWFQTIVQSYRN